MNVTKAYMYTTAEPARRQLVHVHTGGSRLSDIMNDPRGFLPVVAEAEHGRSAKNKMIMVNKSHILQIEEF